MSRIGSEIRDLVSVRAHNVCEYCLIAEVDAFFRFQIEHIISRKHGGNSEPENLALACIFCNRHKGSDIATLIPEKNELVSFYNPRTMRWREHFQLHEAFIKPLTEIGEATVRILQMNGPEQLLERQVLFNCGRYPSEPALHLITEH